MDATRQAKSDDEAPKKVGRIRNVGVSIVEYLGRGMRINRVAIGGATMEEEAAKKEAQKSTASATTLLREHETAGRRRLRGNSRGSISPTEFSLGTMAVTGAGMVASGIAAAFAGNYNAFEGLVLGGAVLLIIAPLLSAAYEAAFGRR